MWHSHVLCTATTSSSLKCWTSCIPKAYTFYIIPNIIITDSHTIVERVLRNVPFVHAIIERVRFSVLTYQNDQERACIHVCVAISRLWIKCKSGLENLGYYDVTYIVSRNAKCCVCSTFLFSVICFISFYLFI